MAPEIVLEISKLFASTHTAKLSEFDSYIQKARKLIYCSPVTGDVVIFDHSPD